MDRPSISAREASGTSLPQGYRRKGSPGLLPSAATSHSYSVGNRRPAHVQNASASQYVTWVTGASGSSGSHWSNTRSCQCPSCQRQYNGCRGTAIRGSATPCTNATSTSVSSHFRPPNDQSSGRL